MQELDEHMVLNPESKKSFDDDVRKSKAKAKQRVRKFTWFFVLCIVIPGVLIIIIFSRVLMVRRKKQCHAKIRGRVLQGGGRIMLLVQCRLGHHCRMAFDVCGRARMSRGVEKWLPFSFKTYKNMHIRQFLQL